jgi:CBS domain-containing protein
MINARDLMTAHPTTVRSTAPVTRAVELLLELDVRHLPVIGDDGTLVGMLSDRDVRAYAGTARARDEVRVVDVMSSATIAVDAEADAGEIIDAMLENKVGAIPVVDGDGALVGIVSYVDVLRAVDVAGDAVVLRAPRR